MDAEKGISLIVDEIETVEAEGLRGETAEVKKSEPVLWLNAGKLDDETFDEFVNMISGYEGNTVCKIVRGSKRYKMPNGVNYCRGLLAELSAFIDTEDIKFVDKT